MKAMVLQAESDLNENQRPLALLELPTPVPAADEILVRVAACGVCHTDLDVIEGRTPPSRLPMVLGHQVVGRVAAVGSKVHRCQIGERVGVAWISSACGSCGYCLSGRENLCPEFQATGRDANGGYAQFMTVRHEFAHPLAEGLSDAETAPLLCAGAIGYRALRLCGLQDGQTLGLSGFGGSAHLVLRMVRQRYPRTRVFVFARGAAARAFALELGAVWAGGFGEKAPEPLACIIDTTPAWQPVVEALANLAAGGRLVINAIRKEEADKEALLRLDYAAHLWQEKEIKSVANVSRQDVREFLALATEMGIRPEIREFPLAAANEALLTLKRGGVRGALVLLID